MKFMKRWKSSAVLCTLTRTGMNGEDPSGHGQFKNIGRLLREP